MVDPTRSGVMFTVDPSTGDRDRLVIEAAFGLGEVVVGGQVEPDTYVVDKAAHGIARGPRRPQDVRDRARRRRATTSRSTSPPTARRARC